jgi:hypothetical protein
MKSQLKSLIGLFVFTIALATTHSASASMFNLTQYIEPAKWSLGLEPEFQLSTQAGFGGTAKFTYGLNELSNAQIGIGSGSGSRQFRVGGSMTFDFIPDLESQPGMGIALNSYFVRSRLTNSPIVNNLELSVAPYIHKSFENGASVIDPFIALPYGIALGDNKYRTIASLAVGSNFKASEHFVYTAEFNINLKDTDTAISGGFTYYH